MPNTIELALSRIELRAYQTDFDLRRRQGLVPVNVSLFRQEDFHKALSAMLPAFAAGRCAGSRVAIAWEGEWLGNVTVGAGMVGFATVCSVIINGVLLKAGVPMDSRFAGVLQVQGWQPRRFIELIHYCHSSLDPSEIFIRGRLTSVGNLVRHGEGKMLANFREFPAVCRRVVDEALAALRSAGLAGMVLVGETSEPLCEIPVGLNKAGMVLAGGLNPVAAAVEVGIDAENMAMCTMMDSQSLVDIRTIPIPKK